MEQQANRYPEIETPYRKTFLILNNLVTVINWKFIKLSIYDDPEYIQAMNKIAPTFFSTVRDLLVDSIILDLCKIISCSGDSINFEKLLRIAINNHDQRVSTEDLNRDLLLLRETFRPLVKHRNKRIAHFDDQVTQRRYEGIPPLEPISYAQIRTVIKQLNDLMNSFYNFFSDGIIMYDSNLHKGDELDLMNFIKSTNN